MTDYSSGDPTMPLHIPTSQEEEFEAIDMTLYTLAESISCVRKTGRVEVTLPPGARICWICQGKNSGRWVFYHDGMEHLSLSRPVTSEVYSPRMIEYNTW